MKILIIGSGGREHSIAYALHHAQTPHDLHAIPGSHGMSRLAICHDIDWKNFDRIIEFCLKTEIDFVIIGPEDPLVEGLSDALRNRGILVVGPSQSAAQLEGSKVFAKEFMKSAGVPTSSFDVVRSKSETLAAMNKYSPPYVLKADGLAAGKGVFICKTDSELASACDDLFEKRVFGPAGNKAVLEQFMPGWELSYLVLTNGQTWTTLPLAKDHKRLKDFDEGPNTGGMGTVAPMTIDQELRNQIELQIVAPTVAEIQKQGLAYRGVLFIGIMVTKEGPKVLEYNCRFGDPETQVILPLVENDLGQILWNLATGKVIQIQTKPLHAACVVMASPGYPMNPEKNLPIEGEIDASTEMSYFLHAGTKKENTQKWVTSGGRVMNAIGLGMSRDEALKNAYLQSEKVNWMGLQKRNDIGK